MTPRTVGRFDIQGLLGSGGIGQVFVGRDRELGRLVAIKALRPEYSADKAFVARFRAEAASLGQLPPHPNIATLYDLFSDGQQLYMIMELVRGRTLEAVLRETGRLGLREALAIMAQAITGLGYAHQHDVIHRDIKPSNLMLTDTGLLKIMDFGIARVRGAQRMTRVGSIVGTLAYLAPEQIRGGEGDERSDLYSLACVLYEMLSGDTPFNAESEYELIRAQVEAKPTPLTGRVPGLSPAVEHALMRALAKEPDERFASVAEFGKATGANALDAAPADILLELVRQRLGPSEPAPSAAPPRKSEQDETRVGPQLGAPLPAPAERRSSGSASAAVRPRRGMALPVAVLGVAAVFLLCVGYLLMGGDLFSGSPPAPSAQVATTQPSQPPPEPEAPTSPPRQFAEQIDHNTQQTAPVPPLAPAPAAQQTSMADLPHSNLIMPNPDASNGSGGGLGAPQTQAGGITTSQVPNSSLIMPDPDRTAPLSGAAASQGSAAGALAHDATPPQLAMATPFRPPAQPDAQPSYSGRVANWLVPTMLFVPKTGAFGFRSMRLFGIVDPDMSSQDAEAMHQKLKAFIDSAADQVVCYPQADATVRCFANGQDIALWALRAGLAKPSSDAPQEYRQADQ